MAEKIKISSYENDILTEREKHYIRMSLIKNVKNTKTRKKIMTAAFAHQDEINEDGALESMVYYLMNNKSQIDKYYKMALGGVMYLEENGEPEKVSDSTPVKRKKGKNKK
jgi:hypothetical protein